LFTEIALLRCDRIALCPQNATIQCCASPGRVLSPPRRSVIPLQPMLAAGRPVEKMARHPEYQYLDLLATILEKGDRRVDRTKVGTLSIFGAMARFDLGRSVPILTTKRVYWKTEIKDALWFLTGSTSLRPLLEQNVHIWTDW